MYQVPSIYSDDSHVFNLLFPKTPVASRSSDLTRVHLHSGQCHTIQIDNSRRNSTGFQRLILVRHQSEYSNSGNSKQCLAEARRSKLNLKTPIVASLRFPNLRLRSKS